MKLFKLFAVRRDLGVAAASKMAAAKTSWEAVSKFEADNPLLRVCAFVEVQTEPCPWYSTASREFS